MREATDETARAEAERDFLAERTFRGSSSWVGVSSTELVRVAMEGGMPNERPWDESDLSRCEGTYDRAPDHLKPVMLRILKAWRILIAERPWKGVHGWGQAEEDRWFNDALARVDANPKARA